MMDPDERHPWSETPSWIWGCILSRRSCLNLMNERSPWLQHVSDRKAAPLPLLQLLITLQVDVNETVRSELPMSFSAKKDQFFLNMSVIRLFNNACFGWGPSCFPCQKPSLLHTILWVPIFCLLLFLFFYVFPRLYSPNFLQVVLWEKRADKSVLVLSHGHSRERSW